MVIFIKLKTHQRSTHKSVKLWKEKGTEKKYALIRQEKACFDLRRKKSCIDLTRGKKTCIDVTRYVDVKKEGSKIINYCCLGSAFSWVQNLCEFTFYYFIPILRYMYCQNSANYERSLGENSHKLGIICCLYFLHLIQKCFQPNISTKQNGVSLAQVLSAVYQMKSCFIKMCLHKEYWPIMKEIYSGMLVRMILQFALALILDRRSAPYSHKRSRCTAK